MTKGNCASRPPSDLNCSTTCPQALRMPAHLAGRKTVMVVRECHPLRAMEMVTRNSKIISARESLNLNGKKSRKLRAGVPPKKSQSLTSSQTWKERLGLSEEGPTTLWQVYMAMAHLYFCPRDLWPFTCRYLLSPYYMLSLCHALRV